MEQFEIPFPKGTTHVMTIIPVLDDADPHRAKFKLLSDRTEYAYVQYNDACRWEVYQGGAELNAEELEYIGHKIEAQYR